MKYLIKPKFFTENKKYLKIYENFDINNIKRFVMWKSSKDLQILEVFKKVQTLSKNDLTKILPVDHLYTYSIKNDKLLNKNNMYEFTTGLLYDDIEENLKIYCVYQSDNLKDCLEMLSTISNSIKYNL